MEQSKSEKDIDLMTYHQEIDPPASLDLEEELVPSD